MNLQLQDKENCSIAAMVGPEDLRRGDFIAILSEIIEFPSFLWSDTLPSAHNEVVRLRRLPTDDRAPFKVKAICLPFVFVKSPSGQFQIIDVRLSSLVRLDKHYAKKVWKALKAPPAPSLTC